MASSRCWSTAISVLYETVAICLHLADTHPEAGLAPAARARPTRAHFYKWFVWCSNTLQAMLMHYFYGDRMVDEGDAAAAAQVKAHAEARIGGMLDQLDAQLASHRGDWLLGPSYAAVDPFAMLMCRWTRGLRPSGAEPAASRALPAAGAGAAGRAARVRDREPATAARLDRHSRARPWGGRSDRQGRSCADAGIGNHPSGHGHNRSQRLALLSGRSAAATPSWRQYRSAGFRVSVRWIQSWIGVRSFLLLGAA